MIISLKGQKRQKLDDNFKKLDDAINNFWKIAKKLFYPLSIELISHSYKLKSINQIIYNKTVLA